MRHKGRLSDEEIKASKFGRFIGLFIGRLTIPGNGAGGPGVTMGAPPFARYSTICYLLRNKSGERFVLPRTVIDGRTSVPMSQRKRCDEVDLVKNIDVPAQEWENLLVQEVIRNL